MSRAVYIGGCGIGPQSAGRTAGVLQAHFEEVEPFTYPFAKKNPDIIRKAVKGAHVITLSMGIERIIGTSPEVLHMINPVLPRSQIKLMTGTIMKTFSAHAEESHSLGGIARLLNFDATALAEMAFNFPEYLGPVVNGRIARFDAIKAAINLKDNETRVIWTSTQGDLVFPPSDAQLHHAAENGIEVVRMAGGHDKPALHPEEFYTEYFQRVSVDN